MVYHFNVFRVLGDVSHTVSKLILLWAIHSNRSAEGVSLITQVLYIFVFCTRYLDIFISPIYGDWEYVWNFVLKLFYVFSSMYIVFIMMRVFARTREREKGWRLGTYSLLGSAIGAPFVYLIFRKYISGPVLLKIPWTFSEILESTCVLPQLLLLRQTTVPTVIDSFYLVTLGSYRAFYILNWIVHKIQVKTYVDPVSWIFGIVQTALYVDFAWVYWTRQRVKLRNGGVVDNDDLSRGWLIGRVLGGRKSGDLDEESTPALSDERDASIDNRSKGVRSWGPKGISVSADDEILESRGNNRPSGSQEESEPLADPRTFEDEDSDEEPDTDAATKPSVAGGSDGGEVWAEERPPV